jgi:hypothetical protein
MLTNALLLLLAIGAGLALYHMERIGPIRGQSPTDVAELFWAQCGHRVSRRASIEAVGTVDDPAAFTLAAAGFGKSWLISIDEPGGRGALVFIECTRARVLWVDKVNINRA